MKSMEDLLQQAQLMQSKMADIQQGLAEKYVEGSSGGGMVRVTATGKQDIVSVRIEKSVISQEDAEMLQDLVTAAVNDALRRSRELAEKELSVLTGGFKLPGFL